MLIQMIQKLTRFFVWILIFQVGVGFSILSYAQDSQKGGPRRNYKLTSLSVSDFARPVLSQKALENPAFEAFVQAPSLPRPVYQADDPAIDSDPFFLRSQSWSTFSSSADSNELSFSKDRESNLTLHVPALKKSLQVDIPLTPFYFSDEYIFLSLDKGSDLFKKAAQGDSGEGIFFLSYAELLAQGAQQRPVHIHFFPLPGKGWMGPLDAEELPQIESLMITTKDEGWLPLDLRDVQQVQEVQRLNSLLGSMVASSNGAMSGRVAQLNIQELTRILKTSSKDSKEAGSALVRELSKLGMPLPARGSTYGFGTLFTGIDFEHSENTVWKPSGKNWFSWSKLNPFSVPNAYAGDVYAELIDKMIVFGWTFGGIVATSIALKYTVLKERLQERRAIEALEGVRVLAENISWIRVLISHGIRNPKQLSQASVDSLVTILGIDAAKAQELRTSAEEQAARSPKSALMREIVESGDVLAHVLTTISQFPTVLTANALERMSDRYLPRSGAENRLLRKILDITFLWSRKVNTNTPVSMKTFMLGAVVMGTVDTAIVAFQDIWMIPEMCKAVAPYLPKELEQRVYDTFDPENPATRSLVVNDVIRNYVAWFTSGAFSYSVDSQAQQEAILRQQVDNALRRMGKNPLAPEHQHEREKLFNEALNVKLKQLGLPDQQAFLFDAGTIDAAVMKALGYRVSDEELKKVDNAAIVAHSRPGLLKSALLLSLKEARVRLKNNPTDLNRSVIELLETIRQQMSLLSLDLSNPMKSWQQIKKTRSSLALLTYSGDVSAAVRYVPELWSEMSPEAAQAASVLFRQAYFSYFTGDGTLIQLPEDFVAAHLKEVSGSVSKSLSSTYQADPSTVWKDHEAEFVLGVEQKLREKFVAQKKSEDSENYKYPELGWYEKRQHQSALRKANERLVSNPSYSSLTAEGMEKLHRKYYGEAMANEVALYMDHSVAESQELIDYVHHSAEEQTAHEIENNPGLKRYLEKLSGSEESTRIHLWLYALNFVDNYKIATVDKETVPPLSVAQPGFTQKIRQMKLIRDSKVATVLARGMDSFFSDEVGHKPGLVAKLDRNFPVFYDLRSSISRSVKSFTSAATVKYEFNRIFWNVNIPAASYALMAALGFMVSAPSQWLNRLMRQQGIKPMGGVLSKIGYGIPYAFVTFGGLLPWFLYSKDAVELGNALVKGLTESQLWHLAAGMAEGSMAYLPVVLLLPLINEVKERVRNRMAVEASKGNERPISASTATCEGVFSF